MTYQVEIVGPSGQVHYTRPINDPMVSDALKTPGYAVRWPGCSDMAKLGDLPTSAKYTATLTDAGLTASCVKVEPRICSHCGAIHLPGCNVLCDY